jgi:hypothetical protein
MSNQLTAEDQLGNALRHFKERVKNSGLILWYRVFDKKLTEIKDEKAAKDSAIYGELMQIEALAKECEPSESSAKLIQKIYKLKGVVGVLCLSLVCLSAFSFSFNGIRPARRNFARGGIHRVIRKHETA